MAERFFTDGIVWYKDPHDPTGTPVRITKLAELSKRVSKAVLEAAIRLSNSFITMHC